MKTIIRLLVASFAALSVVGSANALDKSGRYSGWFGWHSFGEVVDLGDGDIYWYGAFNGAFRNDAGSGFMHNAAVKCPGVLTIINGTSYFQGNCIITDSDRDSAILTWLCEAPAGERCNGPMTWAGGTGKYQGISGSAGTFNGGMINAGPQGYSSWRGNWRLP